MAGRILLTLFLVGCFLIPGAVFAQNDETAPNPPAATEQQTPAAVAEKEAQKGGVGRAVLFYLPNRICDVLDIVRLRFRIGPGIAAGVRVTEGIEAYLGAYQSIWAGLHGPRTQPHIPWPLGVEGAGGVKVLFIGEVVEPEYGPKYQWDEIGADAQAFLVGLSLGVSFSEILDFATGLIFIDINHDDFR